MASSVHPLWNDLLRWLALHGMVTENLLVEARSTLGAGYGLFARGNIEPSTGLFSIPATALMNSLTLRPHYPTSLPKLSCTQIVSLHLLLHRPGDVHSQSDDPFFGPFIAVLPRNFDSHPLTWLWKENERGSTAAVESQLLDALPGRIIRKLNHMFGLFKGDWNRIKGYLRENVAVARRRCRASDVTEWEEDYLWAWLNVNTRCIYHRLAKARSSPENMTLCPILDFANHTYQENSAYPQASREEIWDTGPKLKLGECFVLLSPSTSTVVAGEQLFLRYGMHANSTLFAEYGFVNMVDWRDLHGSFTGEIEVDDYIETLFECRGSMGSHMKNILLEEGYWGDWNMQTSPPPAHPSYRLITALRLLYVVPSSVENILSSQLEPLVDEWRNTTNGYQDIISSENELHWRGCLRRICEEVITKAGAGLSKVGKVNIQANPTVDWPTYMTRFMEMLWQEEIYVATEVLKAIDSNVEF